MFNIQFVYYIMPLYNVSEIRYSDVLSINRQLNKIKRFKKTLLGVLYKMATFALICYIRYILCLSCLRWDSDVKRAYDSYSCIRYQSFGWSSGGDSKVSRL